MMIVQLINLMNIIMHHLHYFYWADYFQVLSCILLIIDGAAVVHMVDYSNNLQMSKFLRSNR